MRSVTQQKMGIEPIHMGQESLKSEQIWRLDCNKQAKRNSPAETGISLGDPQQSEQQSEFEYILVN